MKFCVVLVYILLSSTSLLASEILSAEFDSKTMSLSLKLKESTSGNKNYGLAGGCFRNIQPNQCIFSPYPLSLSLATAVEVNEVTIPLLDLRRFERTKSGIIGSIFLEPKVAQIIGEFQKIEDIADLPTLFGSSLKLPVVVRIVGDNNTDYSFTLPNGFTHSP